MAFGRDDSVILNGVLIPARNIQNEVEWAVQHRGLW